MKHKLRAPAYCQTVMKISKQPPSLCFPPSWPALVEGHTVSGLLDNAILSSPATPKSCVLTQCYKAVLFVCHSHYSKPFSSRSERKTLHREKMLHREKIQEIFLGFQQRSSFEFQQSTIST